MDDSALIRFLEYRQALEDFIETLGLEDILTVNFESRDFSLLINHKPVYFTQDYKLIESFILGFYYSQIRK